MGDPLAPLKAFDRFPRRHQTPAVSLFPLLSAFVTGLGFDDAADG